MKITYSDSYSNVIVNGLNPEVIQYPKSMKYDRPGECGPEKDCL